ncbi:MAG: NUDIX hydrolase [Bacteroidota bacterium]
MRLKSFVLIEKENRYLLIQESSEKWRGTWYLPGGSVKSDETPEMGAIREVKEEAGCDVELQSVFFVKYHSGFFNKKVTVYYCGKMIGEKIKTEPDNESLAVQWFTYEELDRMPLRKNLKELITIYRNHTGFTAVKDFRIIED